MPLADPEPFLTVALVLRKGQPPPLVDRFERVVVATAAVAGWLEAPAGTQKHRV